MAYLGFFVAVLIFGAIALSCIVTLLALYMWAIVSFSEAVSERTGWPTHRVSFGCGTFFVLVSFSFAIAAIITSRG